MCDCTYKSALAGTRSRIDAYNESLALVAGLVCFPFVQQQRGERNVSCKFTPWNYFGIEEFSVDMPIVYRY